MQLLWLSLVVMRCQPLRRALCVLRLNWKIFFRNKLCSRALWAR
ncbi:acetyltransferase [Vibrio cholerae]|nr:acetyltransferase [Vibrio cholerae]